MCNYSTINPRTFYHPEKKLHIQEHVSTHPAFAPTHPRATSKLHSIPTDLPLRDISRKWNSHVLCGHLSPGSSQRYYSNILSLSQSIFFLRMWIILKVIIIVTVLLLLCIFSHEACEILVPRPGIEPTLPTLEGEVLTLDHQGNLSRSILMASPQKPVTAHVPLLTSSPARTSAYHCVSAS